MKMSMPLAAGLTALVSAVLVSSPVFAPPRCGGVTILVCEQTRLRPLARRRAESAWEAAARARDGACCDDWKFAGNKSLICTVTAGRRWQCCYGAKPGWDKDECRDRPDRPAGSSGGGGRR